MTTGSLGQIIYSYVEDHLKNQKGLRTLSIKSYRDTLRLFLVFAARNAGRKIARLTLADLTFERVVSFLRYLEAERRNQVRTRNQRLAALRTASLSTPRRGCPRRWRWQNESPRFQPKELRSTKPASCIVTN